MSRTIIARAPWFELAASDDAEAELLVYGEIGDLAALFDMGVGPRQMVDAIREVDGRRLTVRVNSSGGDAFGGIAIHNALIAREGETVARVEGLAASAASVIVMGADRIEMASGSMLMIHDASCFTYGPADDQRKSADLLDKLSDELAGIYARRAGVSEERMRADMRAETWFTADEAVAIGLADVALADGGHLAPADADAMARRIGQFQHPPGRAIQIAAQWIGQAQSKERPTMDKSTEEQIADLQGQLDAAQALASERAGVVDDLQAQFDAAIAQRDEVKAQFVAVVAERDALQAQLAEALEAQRTEKRDALIDAAFDAGKIIDAQREHFVAFFDAAPEACAAALDAIPRDSAWNASGSTVSNAAAAANVTALNGAEELRAEARRHAAANDCTFREALRVVAKSNPDAAAEAGYNFEGS